MDKVALTKWKKEYHKLSIDNKDKLKKNVMKSNKEVADGIERGNKALIKKHNFKEEIDNKSFQKYITRNGKVVIVSPESLADLDYKNTDLSKSQKIALKSFDKFTGVKKLDEGDKLLYNASAKRNAINKATKGFNAQIAQEGAFMPYYSNKKFPKKMAIARKLSNLNDKNEDFKSVMKQYGNKIDVRKDVAKATKKDIYEGAKNIAQDKPYRPLFGVNSEEKAMKYYKENKSKFDKLQHTNQSVKKLKKINPKVLGAAGVGTGLIGASYIAHKEIKKKHKQKKQK